MRHALLVALLSSGCSAQAPEPCGPAGCRTGQVCRAQRCVSPPDLPAKPSDTRLVIEPSEVATTATRGDGSVLAAAPFGDPAHGTVRVLLRLTLPGLAPERLRSAFLVLERAEAPTGGAATVEVTVLAIRSRWVPAPRRGHEPELGGRPARGVVTPGTLPLRVDVTHLVREGLRRPSAFHGLGLSARPGVLGGAFALGRGSGPLPYLELYVE